MNIESKKIKVPRNTFLKGVHIHFDHKRENLSFRSTLKIDKKEMLGYNNFSLDIKGLFSALMVREQYIREFNLRSLKPIKTALTDIQFEKIKSILKEYEFSKFILLEELYIQITKHQYKELNLEEIEKEIKRN